MKCKCLAFAVLFAALLLTLHGEYGPALAQPPAGVFDPKSEAAQFESTKQRLQELAMKDAPAAIEQWRHFLDQMPHLSESYVVEATAIIGALQLPRDPAAALATYDAVLQKNLQTPTVLELVMAEANLLQGQHREADEMQLYKKYWPLAVEFYRLGRGRAYEPAKTLIYRYLTNLEKQQDDAAFVDNARQLLIQAPSFTVDYSRFASGWPFDSLTKRLIAKRQYGEALAFAKLRLIAGAYDKPRITRATASMAEVWSAKDPTGQELGAFLKSQTEPTVVSPLKEIQLPTLPPENTQKLLSNNRITLTDHMLVLLMAGRSVEAMNLAVRSFMLSAHPRAAELEQICRVLLAVDGTPRRANTFLQYLKTGQGDNPVEAFYRENKPALEATRKIEAEQLESLQQVREKSAAPTDPQQAAANYIQFYNGIPDIQPATAVAATLALGQVYEIGLRDPAKALATYRWGVRQYAAEPAALSLRCAELRLAHEEIAMAPITVTSADLQLLAETRAAQEP
jgi:hypothetical protein